MIRVLLTDHIAADAVRVLESFGGIEAVSVGTPSSTELLRIIADFEAIVVRSPTRVTAEVIERGAKLRFIGRAGVGVDNIDLEAATRRGIVVLNSPRSNTVSTAEHTLALMLAVARESPRAHATVVAPKLGADVPACLLSLTARGEGGGDRVHLVYDPSFGVTPVLLINPLEPLSTGAW